MLDNNKDPYEDQHQYEDRYEDDFFHHKNEPLEHRPWNMEVDQFCMLMHLSQFAGFVVPFAGFVLPIVMWSTNKDESHLVDQHGKNILNWIISSVIYTIICVILFVVLIGIPLLIALAICSLIFTIMGAVKASEGVVYKYPLSIQFLK